MITVTKTIITENKETVSSRTELECTDDQVKRLTVARVGLSNNCGYFTSWMKKRWTRCSIPCDQLSAA
jgi:hypothetical protein